MNPPVNLAADAAAARARDPAVAAGAAALAPPTIPDVVGAPAPAAAPLPRSLLAMSPLARLGLALVVCGAMWAAVVAALAGAGR